MECILNLADPQYKSTQANNYKLSVLLCQDGFSFLVTRSVSKEILKLSSYILDHTDIQLEETGGWPARGNDYFGLLNKVEFIQQSFQSIDIAVASHKISVAPYAFFERADVMNIMSAAHVINIDEEILTEPISNTGPVAAIIIPRYIGEYSTQFFPGSVLRNAAAVFVKGVMHKHSQLIARQIFINIHHGYFEITVIQGSRLLYLNAFRFTSPSDVLYYVIFVLEQLGFVPSEEKVTLMGDIAESSTIASQLKMYCASLEFAALPDGIRYGDAFAGIDMHNYFTLLNIPICE